MAWIQRNTDVEVSAELEYNNTNITTTNAYTAEVTECYLKDSTDTQSKSKSLVVGVKTDDDETARTYFTIMGRDGNTYFESTVGGKKVKKQHFGLNIADTLFKIALGKEIFACEPSEVDIKVWNKEEKELEDAKADGFPDVIGKKVGVCVQMVREKNGADSKEYPEITHFFDAESGLFSGEESGKKKTKLDIWLASAKEFKVIEKQQQNTNSFGKKKSEQSEDAPRKTGWGK